MVDRDKSDQTNNQDLISHLTIADQRVLDQQQTIADQKSELDQLHREIFLEKALLANTKETAAELIKVQTSLKHHQNVIYAGTAKVVQLTANLDFVNKELDALKAENLSAYTWRSRALQLESDNKQLHEALKRQQQQTPSPAVDTVPVAMDIAQVIPPPAQFSGVPEDCATIPKS